MDRIKEAIERIEPLDENAMESARARQNTLTKPQHSLGVLEDLSVKIAGITGNCMPAIKEKVIITMAGDHGIVDEGVSAYPKEVTPQMVYNFLRGGAGINVLARHIGARVVVVDMGVAADIEVKRVSASFIDKKIAYGTANMTKGAAMSYDDAKRSIEAGIEILESEIERGMDIVAVGDMGIGNTTPSSAIVSFITGEPVEFVTGRGTGLDDEGLKKKVEAIKKALEVNKPNRGDAIDILAKIGGFEIGGMAGVMLAAASHRIPVVVDGFISGAAVLIAYEVSPKIRDYLIASHLSVESGHRAILDHIGLEPLFNLNMRLGEGTGAALGISIVEASCKILQEMSTFEEAGVSEKASG
jgi:nicotinate-nucleotide--dimethylbenzimidazole phosphoribosyltransferase